MSAASGVRAGLAGRRFCGRSASRDECLRAPGCVGSGGRPPRRRRGRCEAPASQAPTCPRDRACRRAAAIAIARAARRPRSDADDLDPVRDEARLAHAPRRERRPDDRGDKSAEWLGIRFSHRETAARSFGMEATLDRARNTLKRRGVAAAVLAWFDVHRRDSPWRAAAGEAADPTGSGFPKSCSRQTTATGAALFSGIRAALAGTFLRACSRASLEEVIQAFAGLGYHSAFATCMPAPRRSRRPAAPSRTTRRFC